MLESWPERRALRQGVQEGEETKARRGRTDQPNLEKTSQLHLLEAADHFDDEDEVLGPFGSAFCAACRSDGDPREKLASYILANFDLFTVPR